MKKRIFCSVIGGLMAASGFWLPLRRVLASGHEVEVVVNKSNSVTSLSLDEAREIFMGERTVWPGGGRRITVLMLAPGQPERLTVLRAIYKMIETDYSRYFLEAIFTGRLPAPPKEASSAVQMKHYLAADPWAIGYLNKEDVDDTVKVVLRIP